MINGLTSLKGMIDGLMAACCNAQAGEAGLDDGAEMALSRGEGALRELLDMGWNEKVRLVLVVGRGGTSRRTFEVFIGPGGSGRKGGRGAVHAGGGDIYSMARMLEPWALFHLSSCSN